MYYKLIQNIYINSSKINLKILLKWKNLHYNCSLRISINYYVNARDIKNSDFAWILIYFFIIIIKYLID